VAARWCGVYRALSLRLLILLSDALVQLIQERFRADLGQILGLELRLRLGLLRGIGGGVGSHHARAGAASNSADLHAVERRESAAHGVVLLLLRVAVSAAAAAAGSAASARAHRN